MDDFTTMLSAAARANICTAQYRGFNPPTQDRTRQKTDLIVASSAFLLQRQPFMDISVNDIAQKAGCAVTSVYARFDEKDAILPAVHLLTLELSRPIMTIGLDMDNFKGATLFDFALKYVLITRNYFSSNFNFVVAASGGYSKIIDQQTLDVWDDHGKRLGRIVTMLIGVPEAELWGSLQYATLRIIDTFRSAVLFAGGVSHVNVEALARMFVLIVEARLEEPSPA